MAPARSVEGESVALARAARAAGTRVVFGIPGGGANLTLIQACADAGIAFVLVRSESAAVLAAAAYADVADAPGLAVCTRGPGLAAATLGSASALLDRQPVVVATDGTGRGAPASAPRSRPARRNGLEGGGRRGGCRDRARPPRAARIRDLRPRRRTRRASRRARRRERSAGDADPGAGQRPAMIAGIGARRCAARLDAPSPAGTSRS